MGRGAYPFTLYLKFKYKIFYKDINNKKEERKQLSLSIKNLDLLEF